MDLYNNRYNLEKRIYSYNFSPYRMSKELSAHLYNGIWIFNYRGTHRYIIFF